MSRITFSHKCELCSKITCDSRYITRWEKSWYLDIFAGGMLDLDGRTITKAIGKPCNCEKSPQLGDFVKGFYFAVLSGIYDRSSPKMISFFGKCKICKSEIYANGDKLSQSCDIPTDSYGIVDIIDMEKVIRYISPDKCKCKEIWKPVFYVAILH